MRNNLWALLAGSSAFASLMVAPGIPHTFGTTVVAFVVAVVAAGYVRRSLHAIDRGAS